MLMEVRRGFHSAALRLFKQKKEGVSKLKTPNKKAGEWRTFKKAAAYSNFHKSAPEVPIGNGLELLSPETKYDDVKGKMVTFPSAVQASLTHLGSYRPSQHHELFRTHAFLVRPEFEFIRNGLQKDGWRVLIDGARGRGKSTLVSQAHGLAKMQGWSILPMTRTGHLINGSTDAVWREEDKQWAQPMALKRWAKKIAKGNRDTLPAKTINALRTGNFSTARDVLNLVSAESKVLVTVDDVNEFAYKPFAVNVDKDNNAIYHGDMEIPKLLLDLISGELPVKGAVVAATTAGVPNPLKRRENDHAYVKQSKFDWVLDAKLAKAEQLEVSSFEVEDIATYLNYLEASGLFPRQTPEEAYDASGNGNVGNVLAKAITFVS